MVGVAWLVAYVVVRLAIAYAYRRGMLDQPGQRRSHERPTPRGGGIGVVLAVLATMPWALRLGASPTGWLLVAAIMAGWVLVAAVGWWDDHAALPVWPRLTVQALGCLLLAGALIATGAPSGWLPLLLIAGVGSINLHNFMDGIDGLLAQQAIFVFAAMTGLGLADGDLAGAAAGAVAAAACAGFWVFNRPPARVFMGDVGSGALGFLVFALAARAWQREPASLAPLAVLSSTFVVDAGLTLAVRIWRGRRWYSAHREHLYQWLVRRGATHRQAAGAYLGWNLLVCAPLAWFAHGGVWQGWMGCIAAYGLGAATWMGLKRRCLRRRR